MLRASKKTQTMVRVFAVAALAVVSSPVPADGGMGAPGEWVQLRTPQGCTVFWPFFHPNHLTLQQYYEDHKAEYHGTGCTPGEPANGEGEVLIYRGGRLDRRLRGRVSHGVVDGSGSLADGDNEYFAQDFVRGCPVEWVEEGGCNPFEGRAHGMDEPETSSPSAAGAPASLSNPPATAAVPAPATGGANGNVWSTCVSLEDPRPSGTQMIYAFRNTCTKAITISFCMKATYEAAGDWNLCSQGSHKAYDIRAGERFEFPFTPVTVGTSMSDGRLVDRQEVRASGAACIGSTPSVNMDGGQLVFDHC